MLVEMGPWPDSTELFLQPSDLKTTPHNVSSCVLSYKSLLKVTLKTPASGNLLIKNLIYFNHEESSQR